MNFWAKIPDKGRSKKWVKFEPYDIVAHNIVCKNATNLGGTGC